MEFIPLLHLTNKKRIKQMRDKTMAFPVRMDFIGQIKEMFDDPRYYQIFFLTVFLVYGHVFLGWYAEFQSYLLVVGVCLIMQIIANSLFTPHPFNIKSAFISSLSLCLMFKASQPEIYLLAAVITIAGKFLIRVDGRHVFNPTNLGILLTIILTGRGWVSPGQWGSEVIFIFLVSLAGSNVLMRVGRLDTALTFLMVYATLLFTYHVVYLGWEWDVWLHQLSSGTLLLFAFFMITDPVTTPHHPRARIIWSSTIAMLAFLLSSKFYVYAAPLWALFIMSPFTFLLNRYFPYKKFNWC